MQLKLPNAEQLVEMKHKALEVASKRLGPRPEKDDAARYNSEITTYPKWFAAFSGILLMVVLFASGFLSYTDINQSVLDIGLTSKLAIAGTLIFLLAEFVFIVSTLTRKVFEEGNLKAITTVGYLGLSIAFIGNWLGVNPTQHSEPGLIIFSSLVAVIAPAGTLASALIFENMLTTFVHGKEKAKAELVKDQKDWDLKSQRLEGSSDHRNAWASEIWHWLLAENARGRGATERSAYLAALTERDRYRLVAKAMSRLDWFTDVESGDGHDGQSDTNSHEDTQDPESEGGSGVGSDRHDAIYRHLGTRPHPEASAQERIAQLLEEGLSDPDIFEIFTRDELAQHYGISTGSVSNVKNEVLG